MDKETILAKLIDTALKGNPLSITNSLKRLWDELEKLMPNLTKTVIDAVTEQLSSVESAQWDKMLGWYKTAGIIEDADVKALRGLKDLAHPFDYAIFFFVAFKLTTNFFKAQLEANVNIQNQKVSKERRPNLPYYSDLIAAAFIAPEKTGDVREVMKRTGFTDDHIDLLFLSQYNTYNEEMVKVLFLRGVLSKDQMFMRMRELGYTDTRIKEIIQSWEVLPGAQDLFYMVGKEAFEPDIIQMIGLDDEFPVDQLEFLRKQGISDEWARKYWYAHWDQPSVQMGFEMLHRGVINSEELNVLFKAVEMPPFWRDKLVQIAYQPFTRVDVRRMHKMGVLTDQELITSYTDLGYDEEKALKMAEFTIRYNDQGGKDITKGQVITAYKSRMIDRGNARDLLETVGYSGDEAEFMLYQEDFKINTALNEKMVKNIGDKFKLNLIDIFEVRKRLGQLNLLAERMEILIESWEIDKYEGTALASKTDLGKFYLAGIINEDTYHMEMKRLGYPPATITWYKQLLTKGAKTTNE